MVYDANRDRLVVFGGRSLVSFTALDDVWVLTLDGVPTWQRVSPSGAPPAARYEHTAIFDPAGDRMVVMGGIDQLMCLDGALPFDDLWELRFSPAPAWSPLVAQGTRPAARLEHAAAYDPVHKRMVVSGGLTGGFCWCYCGWIFRDRWALELEGDPRWSQLNSAATGPWGHSSTYVPEEQLILEFGGTNLNWGNELSASTVGFWIGLQSSTSVSTSGADWGLLARLNHSAVFDPANNRLVVFGGQRSGVSESADLWFLNLDPNPLDASASAGPGFSLLRAWPNPVTDDIAVDYSLPDDAPAAIALHDVSGRQIVREEIGDRGAGTHQWRLRRSAEWPPGIYFVRMTRLGEVRAARIAITR